MRLSRLVAAVAFLAGSFARPSSAESGAPLEMVVQTGHPPGWSMDLSDDGKFLAFTGSYLGDRFVPELTIRTAGGTLLRSIVTGLDDLHTRADISPDGTRIAVSGRATGGQGARVEIYDPFGVLLATVQASWATDRIEAAFLPDGRIAFCGSDAAGISGIGLAEADGTILAAYDLEPGMRPFGIQAIPGGERVVCLMEGARFVVLDFQARSGAVFRDTELAARDGGFVAAAPAPDGSTMALGAEIIEEEVGYSVVYLPDRHVCPLSLWSTEGALLARLHEEDLRNYGPSLAGLRFLPDGTLYAGYNRLRSEFHGSSTMLYASFRILRIPLDGSPALPLLEKPGGLSGFVAAADGLLGAEGTAISLWDQSGSEVRSMGTGSIVARAVLSFSPDGSRFLVGTDRVRVWSSDGRLEREIPLPEGAMLYDAAFGPSGEVTALHSGGFDVRGVQGELLRRYEGLPGWGRFVDRMKTDGTRVFAGTTEEGTAIIDVGTFAMTMVGWDPGPFFQPSPDGSLYVQFEGMESGKGSILLRRGDGQAVFEDPVGASSLSAVRVSSKGHIAWIEAMPGHTPVLRVRRPDGTRSAPTALEGLAGRSWGIGAAAAPDGTVAVCLRELPYVRLVGPDGRQRDLRGGQAGLLAVAFSPDGKRLLAAAGDGSARVWNLATDESVAMASEGGEWVAFTEDGYFDASPGGGRLLAMVRGLEAFGVEQMALARNRPDILLRRMGTDSRAEEAVYFRRHVWRLVKAGLVPASLPAPEWDALFTGAAADGKASLEACYRREGGAYLLRPDAGLERRIALFSVPAFLARVEAGIAAGTRPPSAAVLSAEPGPGRITLSCAFHGGDRGLRSYNIHVDGVPVFPAEGRPLSGRDAAATETVLLPPGLCRVEVTCRDDCLAESPRAGVDADGGPGGPGTLYYVGFGVSAYKDPSLALRFAAKDARDLRDAFLASRGGWRDAKAWAFTDAQCTAEAVRGAKALLAAARPEDTVVLFVSGHGLHDDDPDLTYYYLTHEADPADLPRTAASFADIESILDGIPATRKLLLMDTCESGEYDEALLARTGSGVPGAAVRGLGVRAAVPRRAPEKDRYILNDLFRRTGAVVFSSSRAGESSFEPAGDASGENGFFTAAVLAALTTPAADADGDGRVSAAELRRYASEAVAERSGDLQHPTVDRDNPSSSVAFPVAADSYARLTPAAAGAHLAAAAGGGNAAVVRKLLEKAPQVPGADRDRALHAAAAGPGTSGTSRLECVKALLDAGADPGAEDAAGTAAATAAYRLGRVEIALALVEAGARPPAFLVAESGAGEALKPSVAAALARGTRVDATDRNAAFWRSIQLGRTAAALVLLEAGSDFYDSRGDREAAGMAMEFGHASLAQVLVDAEEACGRLIHAAEEGDLDGMRSALGEGAFVNAQRLGTNPLMAASGAGKPEAASFLLARGAETEARDPDGCTPLLLAAKRGHAETVRILLASGADASATSYLGETALDLAARGGFDEVAGLLRQGR